MLNHAAPYTSKHILLQARMRKLRVFQDTHHPFQDDPRLVPWTMPPRRLRVKESVFNVPEGFAPLNPGAYRRRFGHLLPEEAVGQMAAGPEEVLVPLIGT